MSRLYKRQVALTVTEPAIRTYSAPTLQLEGFVPQVTRTVLSTTDAATIIRDLRVTASIEKHLGAEPNTCTIKVYNLAETTRARFQRKPTGVRLDAGYDTELGQLFTGDLRWCTSTLEGVDWITSMQIADGDRAHRFARCSRSFAPGVSAATAVADVVKSMGLQLPAGVSTSLQGQYASGVSVHGNSARELTRLLRATGLSWSIQDGRLQILASADVRRDPPIEVSQGTGLIGTVEYGAPVEAGAGRGKAPILSFKMLLYPGLTPGGQVRVKSRSVNGLFRVERVTHSIDTHGADWFSSVEAKQVR